MNYAHFHLIINHLPLFAAIIGIVVLLYGHITDAVYTREAAYLVFVLAAVGGVLTFLSGEPAEETVESIAGINENLIEAHADAAVYALWAMVLLGLGAGVAFFTSRRKLEVARLLSLVVALLALMGILLVARTASTGGKIRHTETAASATQGEETGGEAGETQDDD
jgi:uncharacterized membrane protein